jgi:OPT oligopeptide transporter protein
VTLLHLDRSATTYVPQSHPRVVASEAAVAAQAAAHPGSLAFARERIDWRGTSWRVLAVREATDGVAVGRYLVGDDDRIAWLVDPGVCGTSPEQIGADGKVEKVVSKFDAPKAQLFRLIIDGVLGRSLPWELVLMGVALALMMELCGVPSLPFAVGAYLPLSTSTSIALGGLVRHLADLRTRRGAAEADASPGVLFASGLIAGGAIAGLLHAVLAGVGVEPDSAPWLANPWAALAPFVLLAGALLAVAARRGDAR